MLRGNHQRSVTTTGGSTPCVYIERYQADAARHTHYTQTVLADPMRFADALLRLRERAGRPRPDVVT